MDAKTDELVNRFLLNKLLAEERAEVEARLFSDNEFFETVLAAEGALIDEYLQGRLSGDDLIRAETLFQSSLAQRRDLEFTRKLISAVQEQSVAPERKRLPAPGMRATAANISGSASNRAARQIPIPRIARVGLFVAWLLSITLVGWLIYLYASRIHRDIEKMAQRNAQEMRQQLEAQTHANAELNKQLELERQKRSLAEDFVAQLKERGLNDVPPVLLAPTSAERGGTTPTVKLKTQSTRIHFQLELGVGALHDRFRVIITSFDGVEVWSRDLDATHVRQKRLNLILPANLFPYNDYRIELKRERENGDFDWLADYTFKVRK